MLKTIINHPYFLAILFITSILSLGKILECVNVLPNGFSHDPPSYAALASTTAIVIASIFPVAVHVKGKKDDLDYIENKIYSFISKDDSVDDDSILNAVDKYRDDILSEVRSINAGIGIFVFVTVISSLISSLLFFHWGGVGLFKGERYAIAWHMIIFSLFCLVIGTMYIGEYKVMLRRYLVVYSCIDIIKNNIIFDTVKNKIKPRFTKECGLDSEQIYECKVFDNYRDLNKLSFLHIKYLCKKMKEEILESANISSIERYFITLFLISTFIIQACLGVVFGKNYIPVLMFINQFSLFAVLFIFLLYFSAGSIAYILGLLVIFGVSIILSTFLALVDIVIFRIFIYWKIVGELRIFILGVVYFFSLKALPLSIAAIVFLNYSIHESRALPYAIMVLAITLFNIVYLIIFGFIYAGDQYKRIRNTALGEVDFFEKDHKKMHEKIDEIFENDKKLDKLFNAAFCYAIIKGKLDRGKLKKEDY